MKSINLQSTSLSPDYDMVQVLRPECGNFSVETIKKWASDTLFAEEGRAVEASSLSLERAVNILHRYGFARIKR